MTILIDGVHRTQKYVRQAIWLAQVDAIHRYDLIYHPERAKQSGRILDIAREDFDRLAAKEEKGAEDANK